MDQNYLLLGISKQATLGLAGEHEKPTPGVGTFRKDAFYMEPKEDLLLEAAAVVPAQAVATFWDNGASPGRRLKPQLS